MISWGNRFRLSDTFSEFTYGFALCNELVTLGSPPVVTVPMFPSLIEEGRATGGYDVAFDRPGKPLFLQFKLSKFIRGPRAKEYRQSPQLFYSSFYRMYIRARRSSRQHELLLDLERTNQGSVFYCGPAFHLLDHLNVHYRGRAVERYSRFVRPSELPAINDDLEHWIAFREARGGPTQFFSPHGGTLELDERPILDRFREDLKVVGDIPLGETMVQLARKLNEMAGVPAQQEIRTPRAALAQVALLSQIVLNSTFCVLQDRPKSKES
jgi:hypothetical protein